MNKINEWVGSIAGILGAILFASNTDYSKFGFIAFLFSSITLFLWSLRNRNYGLMVLQIAFTIINVIGIFRWN